MTAAVLVVVPHERAETAAARVAGMSALPVRALSGSDRWERALADVEASHDTAVLILDERTVLLRPVDVTDLIIDGRPVAYLTEDREYWADPPPEAQDRRGLQAEVARLVGVGAGTAVLGNRGPMVLSPAVLRAMRSELLQPRAWSWRDMLDVVPDAASWYAAWVCASGFAGVEPREPAFRTCLTAAERRSLAIREITADDLARSYLGYVGQLPPPAPHWLARSSPSTGLLRAAALRPYLRMPRVRRLMGSRGLPR